MKREEYIEISPAEVLAQVARAVPPEVHENIIIIGSFAAAWWLLVDDDSRGVRTKDVDCVLSPRLSAVEKGRIIAEKLIDAGWKQKTTGDFGKPGNSDTPVDELSAVRFYPPGGLKWFLELLTEPGSMDQIGMDWTRIPLSSGEHYGIPSLEFLSLAVFEAEMTSIYDARVRK